MPTAGTTLMNLCFTKLKTPLLLPQSPHISQSPSSDDDDDDQTNHCRPLPNSSSSLSSPTTMMMINSLYHSETTRIDRALTRSYSSRSDPDFTTSDVEPDFATIYASQRFFVTSPGRSNLIIESTPSISNDDRSICDHDSSQSTLAYVKDSVAVSTYSPNPYVDFRQSMQEMVEARDMHVIDGKANLDYLHELLLCYLTLNQKNTHKFIIGAFVDLLASLRPPAAAASGGCNS